MRARRTFDFLKVRQCLKILTSLTLVFSFFLQPLFVSAQEETATLNQEPNTPNVGGALQNIPVESPADVEFSVTPGISGNKPTEANQNESAGQAAGNPSTPPGEVAGEQTNQNGAPQQKTDEEPAGEGEAGILSLLGESSDLPIRDRSKDEELRIAFTLDSYAGSFNYQYKLTVSPGRNGLTPSATLYYNNQTADDVNWFGYGWNLDIPYIERLNRTGSDNLYSSTYFTSSFDGELATTSTTTTAYGAKYENGAFRAYTFSSNTWLVTDKSGTQYKFGYSTSTRMDDPSDGTKIYRWMLEEVRDRNDNYIKYEYYKGAGYIYPSKIKYTGNGVTDGIFELEFFRQNRGAAGYATSSRPAFEVVTKYFINEVQAKVNGSWVRKYTFNSALAENGERKLLGGIVETGKDDLGTEITLPQTSFTYGNTLTANGWDPNPAASGTIPMWFIKDGTSRTDKGLRMADVNGDALADFIWSELEGSASSTQKIYLNNRGNLTWSYDSSWQFPVHFVKDGKDDGVRLADVNGDLLIDVLWAIDAGSGSTTKKTYLNTGSGWSESSTWQPPEYFIAAEKDNGVRLGDVNGDGLVDILYSHATSTQQFNKIYMNNGAGWTESASWKNPMSFATDGITDDIQLLDVNADGLYDFLTSTTTHMNTGNGWKSQTGYTASVSMRVRYADVNGDNLTDMISSYVYNGNPPLTLRGTSKNTGKQWVEITDPSWDPPVDFANGFDQDEGVRMADVDGDAIPDILQSIYWSANSTQNTIRLANPSRTDQLIKIVTDKGATHDITYKQTPLYTASGGNLLNPKLPIILDTVSQITKSNGVNNTEAVSYTYSDGRFYFNTGRDRRLAGFASTTRSNDAGTKVKTYYHQGNTTDSSLGEFSDHVSKIGKTYRTEITDASNNIYSKKINKWENVGLANDRHYVKLTQTIDWAQDGDADSKHKAESYVYDDSAGNLSQKTLWGEVTASDDGTFTDAGTDKFTFNYTYATSSATSSVSVNLLSQEGMFDQSSNKVKETKLYYDTLSYGNVDKGNLTKQELWKTGSAYASSTKAYNSYGLVTTDTDPRGNNTTYVYDANNLYPATTTNAVSQNFGYQYDYSSGKVKQFTDPNNFVFQTTYDGLDRVTEEKQPSTSTSSTLETKTTFTYTDNTVPTVVKRSDYLDSSNIVDTYSYLDGFNRILQERKEAENTSEFVVKEYTYNNIGLLDKETLPYFAQGSSRSSTSTASKLEISYTYDPLERVTKITNAVGSTTNAYDDWVLTVTDARSKQKKLYKDAYDNLTKVDEINATSTYTTNYLYNGLGNLTKITDALGNVRNFTYDGLGRRTKAEDLHASADSTFASTTYVYDNAGNLVQRYDQKNQKVNFTYDGINRVLTEDFTGLTGVEVTYSYDGCTNGKGQLCAATSTGANTVYTYDPLGRVVTELKKINSNNLTTTYAYDRQGNIVNIVYPDLFESRYTYNNGGQVEKVEKKETAGGGFTDVVSDIDYAPTGQPSYIYYANNTESYFVYNPDELYRLQKKITTKVGGTGGEGFMGYASMEDYLRAEQSVVDENGNYILNQPFEKDDLRTSRSKTYLIGFDPQGNEIRQGQFYSGDIFYRDSAGNLSEIDTILIDGQNNWLMYKAPYKATLDKSPTNSPITFENGGQILSLTFPQAATSSATVQKELTDPMWAGKRVTYKNYLGSGADMVVSLGDVSLTKEFVIANSQTLQTFATGTDYEILFEITSSGDLDIEVEGKRLSQAGTIVSANPAKIIDDRGGVSYIRAPYIDDSDANRAHLRPISIRYEKIGTNIQVTKILPASYFKTTVFPVRTDLTLSPYSGSGDGGLAFIDDSAYGGDACACRPWSYIRATTSANYYGGDSYQGTARAYTDFGYYLGNSRQFYVFDTSSLGSNATVTSASLNIYVYAKQDGGNMAIVKSNQASTTLLQNSDYSRMTINNPDEGATRKNSADFLIGYNKWYLNATGTSWISPTSTTLIAIREADHDIASSTPPGFHGIHMYSSEQAGTSSDPYLEINYVNASSSDVLQDITYTYDAVGNITKIVDQSGTNSKKTLDLYYDDLNRLVIASSSVAIYGSNFRHDVMYNAIGNITRKSDKGNYTYTDSGYINPQAVTKVWNAPYTYDNNGNMLGIGGIATSTWNYNNWITKITKATSTMQMAYDHAGARVKYQVGTTATYYPNMYYDVSATTTRDKHIYSNGMLLASIRSSTTSTSTYYVHTDHLQGSTVITDASSTLNELIDYFPFGELRTDQKQTTYNESRKYIGQEYDTETALSYLNVRYYDGRIGRFASQDPVFLEIGSSLLERLSTQNLEIFLSNPQQMNSYAYANNNPIVNKDPQGLEVPPTPWGIIGMLLFMPRPLSPDPVYEPEAYAAASQPQIYFDAAPLATVGARPVPNSPKPNINFEGVWSKGSMANRAANATKHAADHAADFGTTNTKEYVESAREFVTDAISGKYPLRFDKTRGRINTYDTRTNSFASFSMNQNTGGVTMHTYFKPSSGASYSGWSNGLSLSASDVSSLQAQVIRLQQAAARFSRRFGRSN